LGFTPVRDSASSSPTIVKSGYSCWIRQLMMASTQGARAREGAPGWGSRNESPGLESRERKTSYSNRAGGGARGWGSRNESPGLESRERKISS
jgi:hypothetical protein